MTAKDDKDKKIIDKLLGIEDFHEVPVSFTSKLNKNCGELHKQGIVFPVRKVEIEYIQSATFGDTILIHTRVTKVGNTSITLVMDCYKNTKSKDTLLVKGTIVRLIMDMKKNELLKITEFFKDII
jgi:YbgC/YbaW family acyl-CoA thioester hydrolase